MYAEKPNLHRRQKLFTPGNLRTISLDVTSRCNMKCPHCYAETFANAEHIDIDNLQAALDELYELGVFHYVLQGGEPIKDAKRLETILRSCHPDDVYIFRLFLNWG